jgi:hypothetical protein
MTLTLSVEEAAEWSGLSAKYINGLIAGPFPPPVIDAGVCGRAEYRVITSEFNDYLIKLAEKEKAQKDLESVCAGIASINRRDN